MPPFTPCEFWAVTAVTAHTAKTRSDPHTRRSACMPEQPPLSVAETISAVLGDVWSVWLLSITFLLRLLSLCCQNQLTSAKSAMREILSWERLCVWLPASALSASGGKGLFSASRQGRHPCHFWLQSYNFSATYATSFILRTQGLCVLMFLNS